MLSNHARFSKPGLQTPPLSVTPDSDLALELLVRRKRRALERLESAQAELRRSNEALRLFAVLARRASR